MKTSEKNFNILVDLKSNFPFKVNKLVPTDNKLINTVLYKANHDNKAYPLLNLNSSASNFFSTKSNFFKSSDKFYSTIRSKSEFNLDKLNNKMKESPSKNLNYSFNTRDINEINKDVNNLLSIYCTYKSKNMSPSKRTNKILLDKDAKSKLMRKFKIKNKLEDEFKEHLANNFHKSRNTLKSSRSTMNIKDRNKTKILILEEYFKDPLKSFEKIHVNRQIVDNINNINADKIIGAFYNKINFSNEFNLKVKKMPRIKETYVDNNPKPVNQKAIQIQIGHKGVSQIEPKMTRFSIFESMELQGQFLCSQKNRPIARTLASCFKGNNKLYLFGGLSHKKLEDIWICDIKHIYQWTNLEPKIMPNINLARYGHTIIKYGQDLFIYGGIMNISDDQEMENIIIYNILSKRISLEVMHNQKEVKFPKHHTATLVGDYMVTLGGYDKNGIIIQDLIILDLSKFVWIKPENRGEGYKNGIAFHSSALVVLSDRIIHPAFGLYNLPDVPHTKKIKIEGIYYFGGIDGNKKLNNEIRALRIGKKPLEWSKIPHDGGIPPSERCCSTIDHYENLNVIFMFGGMDNKQFFKDLYLFDLENFYWHKVRIYDQLPSERAEHSSFITDQGLIIFGGRNETMFLGSDFYIINLDIWEKDKKRKGLSFAERKIKFDQTINKFESLKSNN